MSDLDPNQSTFQARSSARQKAWVQDTALLVLTHRGMEHYLPDVMANLDMFWPERPRTFVVTDGDYAADNVIRGKASEFVPLLAEAVDALPDRAPAVRRVILMLEDLCPLAPVPEQELCAAQQYMADHGLSYVAYHWATNNRQPWKTGEWPTVIIDTCSDISLAQIRPDWAFMNSLIVASWDLAYLRRILAAKMTDGVTDAWAFEHPVLEEQCRHYMCELPWPTMLHGLYEKKHLNNRIGKMAWRMTWPASPLWDRLKREYHPSANRILMMLKYKRNRLILKYKRNRLRKGTKAPKSSILLTKPRKIQKSLDRSEPENAR